MKWLDRQADRERKLHEIHGGERWGMLFSQGHKGGEWGQRLNGMEKRCDWLITVMEHIATTIGLFTPLPPPILAHTTLLCTTALWTAEVCVYVLESAHLYSKSQTLACKVPAAVQINTKTLYATRWKHNLAFFHHCWVVLTSTMSSSNAVSHISLRNTFNTHTISSAWLDHFLFKYVLVFFLLTLFYSEKISED